MLNRFLAGQSCLYASLSVNSLLKSLHSFIIGHLVLEKNGITAGIRILSLVRLSPSENSAKIVVAPPDGPAPSRHAMSGARYSNHLHAEEAAGSLEALIRDYESRGRRLRVRTTTSAPNVLPIHHPACLRPARLVNRRCCKRGTRCTVSARRLAAPTPASPLSRLHRRHRRRHRRHRRRHRRHRRHRRCYPTITGTSTSHLRTLVFPPWQHPDLAVFFDEALAASGDEVRSLC